MVIRPADHGIFASSAASGTPGQGYFAGGGVSGSYLSTVDRFLFADDSRTTLGTGLSAATYRLAGNASSVAGYFGGGRLSLTTVDRFLFSNDSRTTLSTGLTGSYALGGMASSVAGYFGGGLSSGHVAIDRVERFLFSNDSRTELGTGLSANRFDLTAMASSVAGYFAGGRNINGGSNRTDDVDRFLFSNDSRTTLGTGLSSARQGPGGMASSVAGYIGGGSDTVDTVDRFLFSNDSRTTLSSGLSTTRVYLAGMASSVAGYFGGGDNDAGGTREVTTVDRFLFADDSRTTLGTGLTAVAKDLAGMANLGA